MSNIRAEDLFHHITITAFMLGVLGYIAADEGFLPDEAKLPFLALTAAGVIPNVCNRVGKVFPILG